MKTRWLAVLAAAALLWCQSAVGASWLKQTIETEIKSGDLAGTKYRIHVPPSVKKEEPAPIILVFPGSGMKPRRMEVLSGFSILADKEGFIAVYMYEYTAAAAFAVLDDIDRDYGIDRRRVYMVGFSKGAFFTYRFAANYPGQVAAIGTTGGQGLARPTEPISAVIIHGTHDYVSRGPVMAERWAEAVGAGNPETVMMPDKEDDGRRVRKTRYSGGKDGAEVVLYSVEPGIHDWPLGKRLRKTKTNSCRDIDCCEVMWEVFSKHARKKVPGKVNIKEKNELNKIPEWRSREPLEVLFIGNSYTYFHQMPEMTSKLAEVGKSRWPVGINVTTAAVGGASLESLWKDEKVLSALNGKKWDFVVLQEQSLRPIENQEKMFEYAECFHKVIKEQGARTVLYLTWTKRDEPAMQTRLNRAYHQLGKRLDALVAPVGVAWQKSLAGRKGLKLHEKDGSHPNVQGAYLNACVFYSILTRRRPTGLPHHLKYGENQEIKIDEETASYLQAKAWEAVRTGKRTPIRRR